MDRQQLISELCDDAINDFKVKIDKCINDFESIKKDLIEEQKKLDKENNYYVNIFGKIDTTSAFSKGGRDTLIELNKCFDSEWQAEDYDKKELIFRKVIRARDKVRDLWTPKYEERNFNIHYITEQDVTLDYIVTSTKDIIFPILSFKNREQIDYFRLLITNVELLEFFNI